MEMKNKSDRKAYADETVANIKKQQGIIAKLENENEKLKNVVSKMSSNKSQNQTMYSDKTPASLEDIKSFIEREKEEQQKIQKYIRDFQDKIIQKKKNLGGYNSGAENETSLAKQIKILENRLDNANQKFNEAIAINKQLRQQIDSLRRERVIFDNLYKKLEKELHEKRKNMADIIERANSAYELRDKANDEIQNAKSQAKRESADFEKDLRELSHTMEKKKKQTEYAAHTQSQRELKQQDNYLDDDKAKTKAQMKDNNLSNIEEEIQKYEENFAKIQAATKITDFDKLVEIFKQNEMNNFDMFKYVNELSNEIEELEKQNQELEEDINQYNGPGNQTDVQNKRKLKDLEEKLSRAENKSEQYEFKYHGSIKLIGNLTNWIETLFNTIDCDKQFAKELAGSHGVTDGNMMIYLSLIEERVNQILQNYLTIQKENDNFQGTLLQAQKELNDVTIQKQQKGEIPTMADEIQDKDQEKTKVLSVDELRKQAQEYIQEYKAKSERQRPKNVFGNQICYNQDDSISICEGDSICCGEKYCCAKGIECDFDMGTCIVSSQNGGDGGGKSIQFLVILLISIFGLILGLLVGIYFLKKKSLKNQMRIQNLNLNVKYDNSSDEQFQQPNQGQQMQKQSTLSQFDNQQENTEKNYFGSLSQAESNSQLQFKRVTSGNAVTSSNSLSLNSTIQPLQQLQSFKNDQSISNKNVQKIKKKKFQRPKKNLIQLDQESSRSNQQFQHQQDNQLEVHNENQDENNEQKGKGKENEQEYEDKDIQYMEI
ncbi:hypothetical protein PPERSA_10860 [Pseudocohnilembus persalinus]|uniref:ODAD1 central coiled coil region domain-containing protein n=1 Tax=Pseudocohnilembus persalinus TaxID=266149 RepID=A0A0V0QDT8_PSEPJ|nr:hypothetical protein PPERSA_10860 [Pseudocohnilembus persalinus]|eukprot:KRX00361.1 hypothetical protein PPERSA_10860 [Pseudocohnilembus persalinus]